MAQDTSFQAFPCPAPIINGNGDPIYTDQPGMTLRDWFAGQAMNGILSTETEEYGYSVEAGARQAYLVADAMLKAREA